MKKKRPPDDVPGDAVASARAVTEFWYNIGRALGDVDRYRTTDHHDAPALIELRIKCDSSDEMGVLVIAKGLSEDGPVIAFHRDENVVAALSGMASRLRNQTAKWKKDEHAKGRWVSD